MRRYVRRLLAPLGRKVDPRSAFADAVIEEGVRVHVAVPPVCRITDYGKYQYTEQKRARQARKHQKTILVKEIKFRPKVDEHDYDFKKKHIERFIEDGDKVKAVIFFRGREIAHPEIGRRILERLMQEVSEIAVAENMPRM